MPRILPLALTTVAIAGLTLLGASPALAFAAPPTLTFAQPSGNIFSDAVVNGECPVTTTSIDLTAVKVGDPQVFDLSADTTFDPVTGLVGGFAVINALAPGTDIVVTLTCFNVGNAVTGTVSVPYTTNDAGATSTATAAGLNSPITVTGDCGTAVGTTDLAFTFFIGAVQPPVYPHFAYTGSPWSHDLGVTPADLGAKVGDSIQVFAICVIDGEPQIAVGFSISSFEVVADVAALPATGLDATAPATAVALLLGAGLALMLVRRRLRA
jgi:hypothetical protein